MEDFKKNTPAEKDIVFSKTVKAGKRIYYIDVKRNRKDELYLSITESKKVITGEADAMAVNYEKHKIFLYQEDFEHVMSALLESVEYIRNAQGEATPRQQQEATEDDGQLHFDIDF